MPDVMIACGANEKNMAITLERYELEQIVAETAYRSAQLASQKTVEALGIACPFLSVREAGKKYGAKRVNKWIKQGRVNPVNDGGNSAYRVSVSELLYAALGEEAFMFYQPKKR